MSQACLDGRNDPIEGRTVLAPSLGAAHVLSQTHCANFLHLCRIFVAGVLLPLRAEMSGLPGLV